MRPHILASLLAVAACGDDGHDHDHGPDAAVNGDATPDAAVPADVETSALTLAPGEFVEAVFEAGPDDRVRVLLSAPGESIAWNIHGHVGGETQVIVEGNDQMSVEYDYVPEAQEDWYLLVGNSSGAQTTIDVTLELYGGATFTEWLD